MIGRLHKSRTAMVSGVLVVAMMWGTQVLQAGGVDGRIPASLDSHSTKHAPGTILLPEVLFPKGRWQPGDNLVEIVQRPPAYCFTPGTPPEVMKRVEEGMHIQPGPLAYFLDGSWSSIGTPFTLTWSFVPDGVSIPPGFNGDNNNMSGPSELFSVFDAQFASQGGRAQWISLFEQMFARWSELTGATYTRVKFFGADWDDGAAWGASGNSNRGDIRIAARNIDGAAGPNVLAFNFFPTNGDMVLDSNNFWANSTFNFRFLRNTIAHEHGHGLGLFHVCPQNGTKLMEPAINTSFDGPQHDSLRAGQRQHGDPFEPDDTDATATDLGLIAIGSPVSAGVIPSPAIANSGLLSIDANGEKDWFRFNVDSPRSATITVTPKGTTYDSSPQNANGTCSSGNFIDTTSIANLAVQLFAETDLVNPLGTANAAPIGSPEILADIFLPAAGNYFVRVFETSSPAESQLYTLDIAADSQLVCQGINCDNGLFCDGQEFCMNDVCFNGPLPCNAGQACDEGLDVCVDLPGACCLPDGTCESRAASACPNTVGTFFGNGTDCADPGLPACLPVDTRVTCQPSSATVVPGSSMVLELFVENVNNLGGYQETIIITRTSGTGTLTVPCPDGARINQKICISNSPPFAPTGKQCDTQSCDPLTELCVDRPDFVFAMQSVFVATSCTAGEIFSALADSMANANISLPPAYLGEYTLDVSADATPGSTFEVAMETNPDKAFLITPGALGIPFQTGPPCTITVADPTAINPPVAATGYPHESLKNRYISFSPNPANGPTPRGYQVTHIATGQSWFISTPRTDGATPGSVAGLGLTFLVSDPTPPLFDSTAVTVLHVGGCMIVPGETYEVRETLDGVNFSTPLMVSTTTLPTDGRWWADVVGGFTTTGDASTTPPTPANAWTPPDGLVNGFDVTAILKAFAGITAPNLTWADLNSEIPDRLVNGNDVLQGVNAFSTGTGREFYPFNVPNPPGPQGQGACPTPPLEAGLAP